MHGRQVPTEKVRKETQRYDLPSYLPQSPTPSMMSGIIVNTPQSIHDALQDMSDTTQRSLSAPRESYGTAQLSQSRAIVVPHNLPYYDLTDSLFANGMVTVHHTLKALTILQPGYSTSQ